jgi:hypothetical protein
MDKRIIYKNTDGTVAVIIPADCGLTIEQIAAKDVPSPKWVYDVPTGVFETDEDTGEQYEVMDARLHEYKFKIVDVADIPTERTARDLWDVDEADLTDGVGA